jgi:nitrate/nitrite transporter NarK
MGGIMYAPTQATIPHWFRKRLGFVLGVSAMGSSVGGTIFPIAARKLIPLVGYIFPFVWTGYNTYMHSIVSSGP